MDTASPTRRRDYRGDRRRIITRVPVALAEQVERDAAAAGLTVSEHLAELVERSTEATPPTHST